MSDREAALAAIVAALARLDPEASADDAAQAVMVGLEAAGLRVVRGLAPVG